MADERKLRAQTAIRRGLVLARATKSILETWRENIIEKMTETHEGIEGLLMARDLCEGMQVVIRDMIDTLEDV